MTSPSRPTSTEMTGGTSQPGHSSAGASDSSVVTVVLARDFQRSTESESVASQPSRPLAGSGTAPQRGTRARPIWTTIVSHNNLFDLVKSRHQSNGDVTAARQISLEAADAWLQAAERINRLSGADVAATETSLANLESLGGAYHSTLRPAFEAVVKLPRMNSLATFPSPPTTHDAAMEQVNEDRNLFFRLGFPDFVGPESDAAEKSRKWLGGLADLTLHPRRTTTTRAQVEKWGSEYADQMVCILESIFGPQS